MKTTTTLQYILALFALLSLEVGATDNVASIDKLDQSYDLAPHIEYLIDPDRRLLLEDITEKRAPLDWQKNTRAVFMGRDFTKRHWFRVRVNLNELLASKKPILFIHNHSALLVELNLWLTSGGDILSHFETGSMRPFHHRDLDVLQYAFELPTSTPELTIIGRVDQRNVAHPFMLPMHIQNKKQFDSENNIRNYILVAFYAVMIALLLYNFCILLLLKQKHYAYYLLFLVTAIFQCAFIDGSTHLLLWPEQAEINSRINFVNVVLAVLSYLAFVWHSLDKIYFSNILQKSFTVVFWLGLLSLLHNIFTPYLFISNFVSQLYPALVISLTFGTIISAMYHRVPSANYLFMAELSAMIGATLFMAMIQGIVPTNNISFWYLHGGILGEALLLSLVLAARTRDMQQTSIENLKKYETIFEESHEGLFQYFINDNTIKCNLAFANIFDLGTMKTIVDSMRSQISSTKEDKNIFNFRLPKNKN